MATRAQQARDEEQRARSANARKRAKTAKKASAEAAPKKNGHDKTRVAGKATYAYEAPREGPPSRKSTRKSANRSKPDSNFNLRESLQKGSPEARARRSKAQGARARSAKG